MKTTQLTCGVHEIPITETLPEGSGDLGTYTFGPECRIELAPGLSHRARIQTIFHESMHHLDEAYGLKLGENKIRSLEQLILSMVYENTWFWKDLVAEFGSKPDKAASEPPKDPKHEGMWQENSTRTPGHNLTQG